VGAARICRPLPPVNVFGGGVSLLAKNEVEHNSHNVYYRSPSGAAEAGSTVRLGLQIKSKQQINQVLLRLWQDQQGEKLLPLASKDPQGAETRYFSVNLEMPEKGCLLWYYFIISCSDGTCYYGNKMEHWGGQGDVYPNVPPSYQITVYNKGAKTPDWFKHAVMYQIFPDRFYRQGDKLIEKEGAVYHASWTDDPCYYKDPDTKEIVSYDFYGGNIAGIMAKLDYLKELGISVIYFNPVFESESNHHYDTGDYHKIDPILGTNEEFHDLM
jgi:4-alpha-glucanotransferase